AKRSRSDRLWMDSEASKGSASFTEAEGLPDEADTDSALIFRAVNAVGRRRGIRLEAIFWKTITAMAAADGRTLGQQVGDASVPEAGNLASTLRVQAAQWLHKRLSEFERTTTPQSIFAIIHASPTP